MKKEEVQRRLKSLLKETRNDSKNDSESYSYYVGMEHGLLKAMGVIGMLDKTHNR